MYILCVVVEVTGVTYLNNVMYVICTGSSKIYRYNMEMYSTLQVAEVDGMQNPSDIVACHDDHQLYIAECTPPDIAMPAAAGSGGSACIWRVSADGRSSEKLLWLQRTECSGAETVQIDHVETLSLVSRRLLVPSHNSLHQFNTTDGRRLREVKLSKTWELCHGVELTPETFVVSYRTTVGGQWDYAVSHLT